MNPETKDTSTPEQRPPETGGRATFIAPAIGIALCIVSFWCVLRAEQGDLPRSLESVITLGASVVRDVQTPFKLALSLAISAEQEMEVGNRLSAPYISGAERGSDAHRRLQRVARRVVLGARRHDIRYRFHLLPDRSLQAFALCGGHVFVTTGMAEACETEAELAGVIAHEVAHTDLGHTASIVWRQRLDSDLVNLSAALLRPAYSEDLERDADTWGVLLVEASGYHPQSLVDLFMRLDEAQTRAPRERGDLADLVVRGLDAYLQTHPPFRRRIEIIEEVIDENRLAWSRKEYRIDGDRRGPLR